MVGDGTKGLAIAFGDGSDGYVASFEGTVLLAVGERAYAPGRPLELVLKLDGGDARVRAKAIGSKRREDGAFDVRVRLVDLRKDDRARLVAALD
jgi:hypothetical protein